jgi:formylglycine-generating enzyme
MRRRLLAPVIAMTLTACAVIAGIERGVLDTDAGTSSGNVPDAIGALPCPDQMIRVRRRADPSVSFCIDVHEVTNREYLAFLANPLPLAEQIPECRWKQEYTQGGVRARAPEGPVFDVDWCDAHAFCKRAGKRLCGRAGGGTLTFEDERFESEWFIACSDDGRRSHPYGDAFDPAICGSDAAAPVMSKPGCVGADPGLFDMSGNVWEYEDACKRNPDAGDASPAFDICRRRGGSFNEDRTCLRCAPCSPGAQRLRGSISNETGIRCCAD